LKRSKNNGFGKLELIISLMIIGVLAFLSIPIYNSWVAKEAENKSGPSSKLSTPASAELEAQPDSNQSNIPAKVLPKK
jgi:Tfp pilus assembly protein PilE